MAVVDGGYVTQALADRLHPFAVTARSVHGEVVYIAYLLLDAAVLVFFGGNVLNETVHLLEVSQS